MQFDESRQVFLPKHAVPRVKEIEFVINRMSLVIVLRGSDDCGRCRQLFHNPVVSESAVIRRNAATVTYRSVPHCWKHCGNTGAGASPRPLVPQPRSSTRTGTTHLRQKRVARLPGSGRSTPT